MSFFEEHVTLSRMSGISVTNGSALISNNIIRDDVLALLVSRPNVVLTSHQAFLTEEALQNIANTTLQNLDEFFRGEVISRGDDSDDAQIDLFDDSLGHTVER